VGKSVGFAVGEKLYKAQLYVWKHIVNGNVLGARIDCTI